MIGSWFAVGRPSAILLILMRKILISKVILKSKVFPLKVATGVFAEVSEFAIANITSKLKNT